MDAAWACVSSSQSPVARALGMTVLWAPFFASTWQANPMHSEQPVHAGLPSGTPRWGAANKRAMRELFRRGVHVQGPVQEIPTPLSRVELDSSVRDKFGIPVARLSGTTHPETLRTAEFVRGMAEEWLRGAGAERIWSWPRPLALSAGQHQAGTCRMGPDPAESVTDPEGRIHGHDNLFVADGSVHVTNGGFNPVLTIMALAFRTSEAAARSLR